MTNNFYIPINSNSLAHYFGKALILPAKYFTNKPEDIQDRVKNSILISKNRWVKNSDCSIEVVFTEIELTEKVEISDNFSLFNTPIPISRIKNIYFLDSKQKDTTLWNINNGTAFVPKNIVSVDKNANFINDNFDLNYNINLPTIDIDEKIKRFDIILGGFAFMKVGRKDFMTFSENYFSTLSHFNKLIEKQTINAEKEKGLKFSRKYDGLFSVNDSEWAKWIPYIYKNVEPYLVEEIANKEGIKIDKKLGLIDINSINPASHLYDIAILATYGERKSKSIEDLVSNLHNGNISKNKIEDIALLFGLNTGYSKLRNEYQTKDDIFNVKFQLESQLDYYIIESIYQRVFRGNKDNNDFNYIDKWCLKQTNKTTIAGFETYTILDMTIIAKEKQSIGDFFLENYSKNIFETLAKSTKQWLPSFANIDIDLAIKHFQNILTNDLTIAVKGVNDKNATDFKQHLEVVKQEMIDSFEQELSKLREEIKILKNIELLNQSNSTKIEDVQIELIETEQPKSINLNKNINSSSEKTKKPQKDRKDTKKSKTEQPLLDL